MSTVNEKMTAIANGIRTLSGTDEAIGLEAMVNILNIENISFDTNVAAQDSLINQIKNALQNKTSGSGDSYYDKFWDAYQVNGTRTAYANAFFKSFWNDDNFNPKYDIVFGAGTYDCDQAFESCGVTDIADILSRNGITMDTSQAVRLNATFRYASTKSLPPIDCSSATSLPMSFYYMQKLEALHLVNVRADCTFDRTLQYCYALTDLTISGTIGNNFNIIGCTKLNHDSLMSIINALETKTSGTWTCNLTATNLAKLTKEEKAIATQKGWTLT